MIVRVQLFAVAKDLAGCDVAVVELQPNSTVAELRLALAKQFGALERVLPQMMFAVNTRYAQDSTVIPVNAEVACIPPVSGG